VEVNSQEIALPRHHTAADIELAERVLHEGANKTLPPGTVYDLRHTVVTSNGPAHHVISWHHAPEMNDWPVDETAPCWPGTVNALGGYLMLGTFRTPVPAQ
jgi:hypothetical protein